MPPLVCWQAPCYLWQLLAQEFLHVIRCVAARRRCFDSSCLLVKQAAQPLLQGKGTGDFLIELMCGGKDGESSQRQNAAEEPFVLP